MSFPKRFLQGAASSALLVYVPAVGRLDAIEDEKLCILVAIGTIAHLFQPAYRPVDRGTRADHGTAAQILCTVAGTQVLAVVEALYWRFPQSLTWTPTAVACLALAALGLALRTWAVRRLGRYFTWHVRVEAGQRLVTGGPYRVVRHPGYAGALLTYLALPGFLGAWGALAVAAVLLPVAFLRRIALEERALIAEIGQQYQEYRSRTGALFPRFFPRGSRPPG